MYNRTDRQKAIDAEIAAEVAPNIKRIALNLKEARRLNISDDEAIIIAGNIFKRINRKLTIVLNGSIAISVLLIFLAIIARNFAILALIPIIAIAAFWYNYEAKGKVGIFLGEAFNRFESVTDQVQTQDLTERSPKSSFDVPPQE